MAGPGVLGGTDIVEAGLVKLPDDAVFVPRNHLHLEDHPAVLAEDAKAIGDVPAGGNELHELPSLHPDSLGRETDFVVRELHPDLLPGDGAFPEGPLLSGHDQCTFCTSFLLNT